jgi:hypothetical protein
MYKIVSYENQPVAIVTSNPYCNIVIIAGIRKVEDDFKMFLKTIIDKTTLEEYICPHVNMTDCTLKHCSNGKCTFEIEHPKDIPTMCDDCLEVVISTDNIK